MDVGGWRLLLVLSHGCERLEGSSAGIEASVGERLGLIIGLLRRSVFVHFGDLLSQAIEAIEAIEIC